MDLAYEFDGENKTIIVTDGDVEKPIILLLHGTGDTRGAWESPEDAPGRNYDYTAPFRPARDVGWDWYPGIGVWSFELDPFKDVRSWVELLSMYQFRTARYTQVDRTGLLDRPAQELGVVMDTLRNEFKKDRIVVLTQSRGGLLARKFIKDNFNDANRVAAITKVITLHAPHDGSRLANAAASVNSAIQTLRSALPADVVDAALGWLEDIVQLPAYQEMTMGGAFLTDLASGEAALPNAEYHTFGGTSVLLTRVKCWVYTLSSSLPQWHIPPFHHTITHVEVPVVSPVLDSLPNLTEEITEGAGDILTAESRAHLPWSTRRSNPINHAETYWDPNLQSQVLAILGESVTVWS